MKPWKQDFLCFEFTYLKLMFLVHLRRLSLCITVPFPVLHMFLLRMDPAVDLSPRSV